MHKLPSLLGAGLLAAASFASAENVSVTFVQPEKFTDAAYSRSFPSERDRAEVERDIERHLQRLAERRLPAGDALAIEVLDIDLAGHFEPFRFRHGADVRVVRDITSPRIKLRYKLTRGDQVLASGEDHLSDMNFMLAGNRYSSDDRLRYEKALLDDWFEQRISKR